MGIRDIFENDDDSHRLPIQAPGLRDTTGTTGTWCTAIQYQKYFAAPLELLTELNRQLPAQDLGEGLNQLALLSRLRSMLDATEAVLYADTFELFARGTALQSSADNRIQADDEPTPEELENQGLSPDDILANLSAGYYRVTPHDEEVSRSSFIAEAAIAMRDTENHVSSKLTTAEGLRYLCTETLNALSAGEITSQTAREIVKNAQDLEAEDVHRMEEVLLPFAKQATDSAVRQRARRLHEKMHPKPIDERHKDAKESRNLRWWIEKDGMAVAQLRGPAEDIISVVNTVEHHVVSNPDPEDSRTRGQLRYDTIRDALLDGWPEGGGSTLKTKVAVTIPAVEMLADPRKALADLEGYGPIPMGTALKLAADAPSMLRILTDPWSGAVIDVDRKKYSPPQALRDLLRFRDGQCQFPGCNRVPERSEVEHIDDWAKGGGTNRTNTKLCCKRHQMFKHALGWNYTYLPDGSVMWRTPHGQVCIEIPGSVTSVQNFDFNADRTPQRLDIELTDRVRRVLGYEFEEPPEVEAN
ncbi:DUF222 domain-containing protein [Glutamicibacter protophormiae]|uniref:HNH endonuclease signature motif containing protein n=1 Tax=Glutamicibacter protophormiae TaxID=37930 RepID=UPI002A807A6D|nr:DUF222 domain-containing protein [Glutamicibacter protophormiae]WPR66035.1 DUF222 domain-containing protein [Glutamicibacter protophormiae]WPR69532.1 DUF222 domain-containing protein [Glutamicibacter protophormiae]